MAHTAENLFLLNVSYVYLPNHWQIETGLELHANYYNTAFTDRKRINTFFH